MPEHHHAGSADHPEPAGDSGNRRAVVDPMMNVRASDLEPYTGLRYLSTLFRVMAILLVLLLAAEGVAGALAEGRASLPTLLAEASRLLVLAGILWGVGDLAILLIDIGHDVRATRILLGRQSAHHLHEHHEHPESHIHADRSTGLPVGSELRREAGHRTGDAPGARDAR